MLLADAPTVLAAALLALVLDAAIGDPRALYARVPHPVALLGRAITALEGLLYPATEERRWRRGVVLAVAVVAGAALIGLLLQRLLLALPAAWPALGIVVSVLLAWGSLREHVAAVADALDGGLAAGREAVARIVGRDPAALDRHGVARAAVESLAENFSDGVVAPCFWFVLLGLPGICAYKAINTLDSMVGYREARYAAFGRASARLDDLVNWLPARLTAVLLVIATFALDRHAARDALTVVRRDARRHRSPNAGWPEAAVAGALGFRLSGPRVYAGRPRDEPWIGGGRAALETSDVRAAIRLVDRSFVLLVALIAALYLLAAAIS